MARSSALSSTRRTGSIECVASAPSRIAASLAQFVFGVVDGLLVRIDVLLLGFDLGGFFVDVFAGHLLLHGFHGVAVILHVEDAEFALHHVEILLVLIQLLMELRKLVAPGFFVAAGGGVESCTAAAAASLSARRDAAAEETPPEVGDIVVGEDLGRLGEIFFLLSGLARRRREGILS